MKDARRDSRRSEGIRALALTLLGAVFSATAGAQTYTAFRVPSGRTIGIAAGPDGALWFTEDRANRIGRITTSGVITEFPIPTGDSRPLSIAAGPDGALWFTEDSVLAIRNKIGRITTAGVVTEFALPTELNLYTPTSITAGPDGALWFTAPNPLSPFSGVDKICRITTSGAITQFSVPGMGFSGPRSITAGPDGALWFTESSAGKIGRVTVNGGFTEFPLGDLSNPHSIVTGPDGALWLTESYGGAVGRITTAGVITKFPDPIASSSQRGIASGPDGALWFAGDSPWQIGRITTSGAITEFPLPESFSTPGPTSTPESIAAGPDGALWFTDSNGSNIGRITTASAPVIASRALPVVGSTPGANGTFFKTSVQLHNPGSSPIAGQIVFHATGTSGSRDPALPYSLAPSQTQSIADLLPAMGRSGLGSADIEVTSGSSPVVTARVFNDAGAAGTTGFTEEAIRPEEALSAGARGVLLVPSDLTAFRFNIGVRTLELGALIALTLRDAAGVVVAAVPRVFPAKYHVQQPAAEFLTGSSPPPGGSLTVEVISGSAIVYGATVDNLTGDPSLQVARASP